MNRLHHLRQTLPQNLRDNQLPSTRFLVLDYNSDDGLQQYIRENFAEELRQGRLQYHRYEHAKYFSHSHSRNLAARCTDAEYICNVDADNFTGHGFDEFLRDVFAKHPDALVTALSNPLNIYGVFGRMAIGRNHFLAVGGYDESFQGYGFEDYDLVSRLERNGRHKEVIHQPAFLQSIPHDNAERVAQEWTSEQLQVVYRQQVSDSLQVVMYLFRDHTVHYGVVNEDFKAGVHYRYSLAGNAWQEGTWTSDDQVVHIRFPQLDARFEKEGPYLTGHRHYLKMEDDPQKLEEAILFHTNMANCCRYVKNKEKKTIRVNDQGFGHGITETMNIHH